MYCRNCGILIEGEANFCMRCGTPLYGEFKRPERDCTMLVPVRTVYEAKPSAPSLPGKGLGIASMVLGISSLVLWYLFYLVIPQAITGFILGVIGAGKAAKVGRKNPMATVGIVCSSVGFAISLIFTTIFIVTALVV